MGCPCGGAKAILHDLGGDRHHARGRALTTTPCRGGEGLAIALSGVSLRAQGLDGLHGTLAGHGRIEGDGQGVHGSGGASSIECANPGRGRAKAVARGRVPEETPPPTLLEVEDQRGRYLWSQRSRSTVLWCPKLDNYSRSDRAHVRTPARSPASRSPRRAIPGRGCAPHRCSSGPP